jgi:hypothetical protein
MMQMGWWSLTLYFGEKIWMAVLLRPVLKPLAVQQSQGQTCAVCPATYTPSPASF